MDAYNYIIEEYKELVESISKKFYGIDKEDLIQAGNQGLIEAFNNYDDTSNTKFSTYAYNYIYGAMYTLIYKTNDLKITKDTLRLKKLIIEKYQEMSQINQKAPTNSELALELGIDEYLLNITLNSNQKAMSLDAPICEDKDLKEIIPQQDRISVDDKIFLLDSINNLPEPEQSILKYRYYQDLTQKQTALALGLSQVKVSRYEKKGIQRIRDIVKECA